MWTRGLVALVFVGCAAKGLPGPTTRWVAPADMKPRGAAPGVKTRPLTEHDHVLILATGDEVMTAIATFAKEQKIGAARFTAIGAVSEGEVAFFDFGRKQYQGMKLVEQLEMVSLVGDIALDKDGEVSVHAHATLGRADGSVLAGHLIAAVAKPTLEIFLTVYPTELRKVVAPESGTQVIAP